MLYPNRRSSMSADEKWDQAMDMLSGFLFGLGFGLIAGYYLLP
jgi:hypothetical protein